MIYALTADAAHIEEEDVFDATLIEFEGFEGATFFRPDTDYHELCGAPEVIEFVGNLENAKWLDHIFTAPMGLLLISKRMVRVLESVGPFRHRLIPTVIYSEEIRHLLCSPAYRRRTWYQVEDPELRNDDFVILQLVDQMDCLDPDRTLVEGVPFRQSGEQYLGTDDARPLVLRPPPGGFPPVFSVPELVYYCFTEEAKQACDKAGLTGLWWRPQE
jgi:PAS domain-containing protein